MKEDSVMWVHMNHSQEEKEEDMDTPLADYE